MRFGDIRTAGKIAVVALVVVLFAVIAIAQTAPAPQCGAPCWFDEVDNEIGAVTLYGSCVSVQEYAYSMYCCRNEDCPSGMFCSPASGTCGMSYPV